MLAIIPWHFEREAPIPIVPNPDGTIWVEKDHVPNERDRISTCPISLNIFICKIENRHVLTTLRRVCILYFGKHTLHHLQR